MLLQLQTARDKARSANGSIGDYAKESMDKIDQIRHDTAKNMGTSIDKLDRKVEAKAADARLRAGSPVIISDWRDETRLKLPAALRDARVATSVAAASSSRSSDAARRSACVRRVRSLTAGTSPRSRSAAAR